MTPGVQFRICRTKCPLDEETGKPQYFLTLMKTLMAPVKSAERRTSVWSVFRAPVGEQKGLRALRGRAAGSHVTSPQRNTDLRGRSESPWSPGSDTRPPASLLRTPVARWVLGVVRKWPRWPPRCVLKKVSAALTPQTTDITPTLRLFMFVYNPFFSTNLTFALLCLSRRLQT